MIRIHVVLTLLVCLAGTNIVSAEPALIFARDYVDLGRVEAAGDLIERFPFVVRGRGSVEILDLKGSCGCITPTLERRRYEPGERGELTFGIHATSQSAGRKRFQVELTYRQAGQIVTVPIRIDVDLYQPIVVEPSNLLLYVKDARPLTQTITLTDQRGRPLEVVGVSTSSQRLHPVPHPQAIEDPAIRQIDLVVDGEFPTGKTVEQLVLRTSDARHSEIVVPVTVIRPSRIGVLPEVLHGRRPANGASATWQVLLLDARKQPIRITGVSTSDPHVTVDFPRVATPRSRLQVSVSPPEDVEPFEAEITIHVVEPIETNVYLPIRLDGSRSRR